MAERRGSRRNDRPQGDDPERSALIPAPAGPAITYRREKLSPGLIIRLWRSGHSQRKNSRERILKVRSMRRKEHDSLIQLSPSWVRQNPEAASWARKTLHERVTLERDMIARVGAVEPEFACEPLGFLEQDDQYAEEKEAYLNEWRLRNVPVQAFNGKAVEDGEFGVAVLPVDVDMDGCPDFFDMLDQRAYDAMPEELRKEYKPDDADRRGRYVRTDKDGKKVKNPKFDKGTDDASRKAHDDAVQRYLLGKQASAVRLIPALDCVPIFTRGRGRNRWELTALVERTLYYAEELLEQGTGWSGMGDRKLIPMAYAADGSSMRVTSSEQGVNGQFYLYTAYLLCEDEDGRKRPVVTWTVGGASTWDSNAVNPDESESVGLIDLYERYKLPDGSCPALDGAPLWSYHGGLHTEDDDPDHYWSPWMWPLYDLIKSIEGNATAISAATAVNAFTGHLYRPDAKLAELSDEAFLEQDGELKKPRQPRSGEMEPAAGDVIPFAQASVGADAWRLMAADQQSLLMAVASDQPAGAGASGHAQVVNETLAKVGKRHVREGVLEAVVSCGEKQLRILKAIADKYDVRWPLQTVREKPVGQLGESRKGAEPLVFNPEWIGDGNYQNYLLAAEYPVEENLARIDLERSLAKDGFGSFRDVQKARGKSDARRERIEVLKDQLLADPEYMLSFKLGIGQGRGDRRMVQRVKALQAEAKLAQAAVPGASNGVPTAALRRMGERPPGGGGSNGPGVAASSRGGIMNAEKGADVLAANAEAAMTQPGVAA